MVTTTTLTETDSILESFIKTHRIYESRIRACDRKNASVLLYDWYTEISKLVDQSDRHLANKKDKSNSQHNANKSSSPKKEACNND